MAIDSETARLLISCKKAGVNFGRTVTLGRQYYMVRPAETRAIFRSFGLEPDARLLKPSPYSANHGFAEPLFECLGATRCEAVDVSDYEGANLLHDLNEPLPPAWAEQFDVVFDGGTLEHVFNFPQALHNSMQMVKPGGWFIGFSPANNWFGHGFYQFSPEVYYRALSPRNGFSKCGVFMVPEGLTLSWYLIRDPIQLKTRTNLINSLRTPLLIVAQKSASTPAKLCVQQSDYVPLWNEKAPQWDHGKVFRDKLGTLWLKDKLYALMPGFTRRLATLEARGWCREYSIHKPQVFQPLNKAGLPKIIAELSERK